MKVPVSPFATAVSALTAGGLVIVLGISWFRSRAALASKKPAEWVYTVALWALASLLGLVFYLLGPMPLAFSVSLAVACTLGVSGLIWPDWMHDPRLSPTQRFVQRMVVIVVSCIVISIAAGHFG
ncbi:MAG: hypothetical protein DMD54_01895 [Gemmatimonadetes bacterium]|nr:MAG: hypothetical protein DMD54_01895 [Gemmatimonadota bacterium]